VGKLAANFVTAFCFPSDLLKIEAGCSFESGGLYKQVRIYTSNCF